ncbi:MAG: hypothetical protein E5X58_31740 [Mesorhizobium sp.]|nr:MAG: hypothetical protein E5X58_31740 [Mesorhizobium sp.]
MKRLLFSRLCQAARILTSKISGMLERSSALTSTAIFESRREPAIRCFVTAFMLLHGADLRQRPAAMAVFCFRRHIHGKVPNRNTFPFGQTRLPLISGSF